MRRARAFPWLLCSLLWWAAPAAAAEWHEAYRDGVNALAQGQPMRAVTLLEFAAGQRPQPGRNVVTYGTNVEARYYPYLRLAEAYLQVRDLAGARSALARSAKWAIEPAEERRRLAAQVEELAARLAPPAVLPSPAAAAAPEPPPATAAPAAVETPRAEGEGTHAGHPGEGAFVLPSPPAARATPEPRATPPSSARQPPPVEEAPGPAAGPEPALTSCSLDIVSQPPGATVYLDDELVGTTDPEWGRLVRSGIGSGRHRVRLSLAGYREVVEEVELSDGASRDFRRRLAPMDAPVDRRPLIFGAVAVVLIGLTVWALRRPRGEPSTALHPGFLDASPTPARPTPPALGSPGVRRAADGAEYFGDYRLLERLGRGGMASVYKAERRGELSALKRPLPVFLDEPEFLERFQREAEIGRTLHHPNIVRILERGAVDDVPYFTMELVPGETLQAHLQHAGALDPRLAARIVVQIAEALDYAHLKGVVHRDLKPSNVMVLEDGMAKVMDYGIARARRFEGLTVTGSFLGSPEYVAPEAIEGKGDARSDLYSLGVMFYEALTGRRPFTADTPFGVLRKHLTEPPPPPSLLVPGLPPELERIVLRLLDKQADRRHAGAEELVNELRDFLNRAA